jgi:LCP family protein required for cell wall assembly
VPNDDEDPSSSTDPPVRPRRRWWLPVFGVSLALVLVAGLIGTSLYAFRLDRAVNSNLHRADDLPPDTPTGPGASPRPSKVPSDRSLNYVLIGSDSRTPGNAGAGRSDALMVLHLSGDRRQAHLISFPRDMYVPIPGHGQNKINAAYALGGPQLTVRTLEGLLDTRMDHVALIDFDGFIGLTEGLGGVTVYNQYPSVSEGWAFPKGYLTIHGPQALAYVRERHQLPHGDLDRAGRQRAVVMAILAKGLSPSLVSSPSRFLGFAAGVAQHVTVDRQLTSGELRKTAVSLRLAPDDIRSLQAPISGFGTSPGKQSIDVVDTARLHELAVALQNDTLSDYLARYPSG